MALFGYYQGRDQVRPVKDANGVIQRTQTSLEVSDGDTPSQKWLVDNRLPVTFTYGFALGVNNMTMGKGLVVSVDPDRYQKDFETQKSHSVLTIANGGNEVKLVGTSWVKTADSAAVAGDVVRPANKPIGVLFSNVMKKVDDQLSGMVPTVVTEKYIKLPLFSDKTKAMANPWGSAYGAIKPGDSVKSDENGRFVKWVEGTDKIEQKVGQVLAIQQDLVPEGAAVWATWATEDRLNSDYFNPLEVPAPRTEGGDYPYDKSYGYNELNKTNPRLPQEFDFKKGIPGLTDGANVSSKVVADEIVDDIPVGLDDYTQARYCRTLEKGTPVEGIQLAVRATVGGVAKVSTYKALADIKLAGSLQIDLGTGEEDFAHVDYADALAGLAVVIIDEKATMKAAGLEKVEILAKYTLKGLAGVPTMLDWDGVIGEIRILVDK